MTHYHVYNGMAGYIPNSSFMFDTEDEAKDFIAGEINASDGESIRETDGSTYIDWTDNSRSAIEDCQEEDCE